MLDRLSTWLAKAEAQQPAGHVEALLAPPLASKMLPLATQVRFRARIASVCGPIISASIQTRTSKVASARPESILSFSNNPAHDHRPSEAGSKIVPAAEWPYDPGVKGAFTISGASLYADLIAEPYHFPRF